MKKSIYITPFFVLLTAACSADKETEIVSNKADDNNGKVRVIDVNAPTPKDGTIPRSKLMYKALFNPSDYTLGQIDAMYREDIIDTEIEYDINLKNMWFSIINDRLVKEGSEDMKRFYLNEQIALKQNLPNLESFYKLLLSCSQFIRSDELFEISDSFSEKNENYIENGMNWSTAAKKKSILTGLHYAGANFHRLMSVSK